MARINHNFRALLQANVSLDDATSILTERSSFQDEPDCTNSNHGLEESEESSVSSRPDLV